MLRETPIRYPYITHIRTLFSTRHGRCLKEPTMNLISHTVTNARTPATQIEATVMTLCCVRAAAAHSQGI